MVPQIQIENGRRNNRGKGERWARTDKLWRVHKYVREQMKESLSFIPGGLVHCSQMGNHVCLGNVKKLLPNSGFFDPIAFSQCFRILETKKK